MSKQSLSATHVNYDDLANTHKMIKFSHFKNNIVNIYVPKTLKFNVKENFVVCLLVLEL